jgi:predicted negative regulator of RcsB-dependent stress response
LTQHILRKDLKKDEVRDTLVHGAEAVMSHQTGVAYIVGIAALVLILVFGWRFYSERQTVKATAAFDDAMKVFQARIRNPGEATDPNEVTYFAEQNKYQDANRKFTDVAMKFKHTRSGQLSAYYAALSLEKLNRDADARKWLEGLGHQGNSDFRAMASFELAQVDERTGQGADAAKIYQQLIDKPVALVPKPLVMLALADHYRAVNPSEAVKLYNQVKTQYPNTSASQQAEQQLELMPGKS